MLYSWVWFLMKILHGNIILLMLQGKFLIGVIYKSSFCLPVRYPLLKLSLSLPCILCFSMGIDLSHKLESYSPTSEKKIIQIISKKPFDAHTDPIFKSLQILKLSEIYFFQVGKFMYSFKIGLLRNVFKEMFLMTNQVHFYNTRNSNTFYLFLHEQI